MKMFFGHSDKVQMSYVRTLGDIGWADFGTFLIAIFPDCSESVQWEILNAFTKIYTNRYRKFLLAVYAEHPMQTHRWMALNAFCMYSVVKGDEEFFEDILTNRQLDWDERLSAALALVEIYRFYFPRAIGNVKEAELRQRMADDPTCAQVMAEFTKGDA